MAIKRYNLNQFEPAKVDESPDGEYVLYSDHIEALASATDTAQPIDGADQDCQNCACPEPSGKCWQWDCVERSRWRGRK